jgi:CP family cyanate transporter-like MFS transporter
LATRFRDQRVLVAATVAAMVVAVIGLLVAPGSAPALWAVLLGLGHGAGLSLSLLFLVVRSPDARTAAELSAMAQTVGYLIAAAGPVTGGLLFDVAGDWAATLSLLLAGVLAQLVFGLSAGRNEVLRTPREVG